MATSKSIEAGGAYVRIFAEDSALRRSLTQIQRRLRTFGSSVQGVGQSLVGVGSVVAAPFAGAIRTFTSYESALADLRANAQPTAAELEQIKEAIVEISRATGTGPAQVAATFTELLKAGMDIRDVLGGAAEAAVQFARVSGMETDEAAKTITKAMEVFGVDAVTAVDTLSRAADASVVDIADVSMAFAQTAKVAADAGLSLEETANAIAILGQNAMVGSDAGTSLRTMLTRLQTGIESAGKAMKDLGIEVRDSATGEMRPFRDIIGELQAKLGDLDAESRDVQLYKLFGADAQRAGRVFFSEGVAGWDEFTGKMQEGLSVADKFNIRMGGLEGAGSRAIVALQLLAIKVGDALAPAVGMLTARFTAAIAAVATFVQENSGLVVSIAAGAAAFVAAGAALIGLGIAASTASAIFGALAGAIGLVVSPIGLVAAAIAGAVISFAMFTETGRNAFQSVWSAATTAFAGIADALKAGDIALAGKILWLSLRTEFQKGVNFLTSLWADWGTAFKTVISDVQFFFARAMVNLTTSVGTAVETIFGALAPLIPILDQKTIDAALAGFGIGPGGKGAAETQAAALASLDEQQAAADEARFAAAQQSVAAGQAELARLRGELQAALDEAEAAANQPPAVPTGAGAEPGAGEDEGGDASTATPSPIEELAEPGALDAAMERSAAKLDTKGTFSAAALRGLATGDSATERTAENTEAIRDGIDRLNDRARAGKLVFTP